MSSGAGPANLVFPSGVDSFSTKVDRNVVISGEAHVIPSTPSYTLFLDYVPLQNNPTTTSIPGFVEVSGTPSTFQFQTTYSGVNAGQLTFNAFQSGLSINVTYTSFGDIVEAEYVNSLQTAMQNVETYVLANVASGSFLHTSGGTITGTVLMNGDLDLGTGSIVAITSGTNTIGANGTPMAAVYTDEIQTNYLNSTAPILIQSTGNTLTLSGTSITSQASIIPNPSGVNDLGSSTSAWRKIYVNELSSNINLAPNVNITVLTSGSNSIGDAFSPIGTLWVDNIFSSSFPVGLSGVFVKKTGDTMTGNLVITSGSQLNTYLVSNTLDDLTLSGSSFVKLATDLTPISSGSSNIGSASKPFDNVYANDLLISGTTSIQNIFVHKAGDTMTGDLLFGSGKGIGMLGGTGSSEWVDDSMRLTSISSVGAGVNISDTNGAGGTISLSAVNDSVPGPSGLKGIITFNAGADDNSTIIFSGNVIKLNGTFDVTNSNSGTNNLGSLLVPFSGVYADNIDAIKSILVPSTPPASGTATGTVGQIIMGTDGYFYGCSGTNLWGRVHLSSF